MGEVRSLQSVIDRLAPIRRDKKVVFTNGCFDLLHVGHVRYLKSAKELGDFLVVGINSDASVRALKGDERPLQNEEDRAEILASLECIDFVILFSDPTPVELIKAIQPDVLVKGGDWAIDKIVGADIVRTAGGQVTTIPFVNGRSTTRLVEKIRQL